MPPEDDIPVVEAADETDAFGVVQKTPIDFDGVEDGGGGMTGSSDGAPFSTMGTAPPAEGSPDAAPMTGSSDGAPFSAQGTTSATSSEVPFSPGGFDSDGQPIPLPTGGPTLTGAVETVAGMAAEAVTGIPVVGPIVEGVLSMSSDTPPVKEPETPPPPPPPPPPPQ